MVPEGFQNSSPFFKELCKIKSDVSIETLSQAITSGKVDS